MKSFSVRPFHVCSLLLVLALAGCATTTSVPNRAPSVHDQQATRLVQQRQYAQAAQRYLALASVHPDQADYFRLRAAQAWAAGGVLDKAQQALSQVRSSQLQSTDVLYYDLLTAEIAMANGQAERALQSAAISADDMPATFQARLLKLRAQALAATGKPWDAARARVRLDSLLPNDARERNHQQILVLLSGLGKVALQQREATLTQDDPMRHWVTEALTQQGMNGVRSAPELKQPVGTLLPGATRGEGYQLPGRVAVVLPLSGRLRATGSTVLQGFFASYFQAGANASSMPPVQVYDSSGTPDGAVAAYQKAVADGAAVVVGPLTRAAVKAVFDQPTLAVPILVLNHVGDSVLPPDHASEFTLRPEVEADQVARHMLERGLTSAIVLVSGESFAQRAAQAFKTQFEGHGGSVTTMVTLDSARVNYAAQIRTLHARGLAHAGIFISMRPGQARLVLPQLHLAGINLPVFATSHVYAGRNNPVADGDLDGVTFCDSPWLFDAQPGLVSRTAIAAQLSAARGVSARFFAFGMDAWSLVPYLDWLHSHPGSYLPGATGRLSENGFGRVHRTLIWARFDHGLAHPLAGSLNLGAPTTQPDAVPDSGQELPPGAAKPAEAASTSGAFF